MVNLVRPGGTCPGPDRVTQWTATVARRVGGLSISAPASAVHSLITARTEGSGILKGDCSAHARAIGGSGALDTNLPQASSVGPLAASILDPLRAIVQVAQHVFLVFKAPGEHLLRHLCS